MENFSESLYKVLNSLMPREFPFVDSVIDVIATGDKYNRNVKFKVILNKDWIFKNFSKNSLDELKKEYEYYGGISLSAYSLEKLSGEKIKEKSLDDFIHTIITMIGLTNKPISSLNILYIIE